MSRFRKVGTLFSAAAFAASGSIALQPLSAGTALAGSTTTPIQHVVVIFQENVSFDHYFATYPIADNPGGEPSFIAGKNTPNVNGLSGPLLFNNPNTLNRRMRDCRRALDPSGSIGARPRPATRIMTTRRNSSPSISA